jgi:hypothetical protein
MIFFNMDYFLRTPREKNGKKIKNYFWGFLVWHHEYS